jgi:hypothetical protein
MSKNDELNKLLDEDGLRNTIHEIIKEHNHQNCSQTLSYLTGLRDIMSQAYRLKYPQKSCVFEVEDDDYDEKENKNNNYDRNDEHKRDTLTYNHYYQVITDKLEELTRKEKLCYIDLLQKTRKTQGGYRKSKKRKTRRKNKAKRGTKKKK